MSALDRADPDTGFAARTEIVVAVLMEMPEALEADTGEQDGRIVLDCTLEVGIVGAERILVPFVWHARRYPRQQERRDRRIH